MEQSRLCNCCECRRDERERADVFFGEVKEELWKDLRWDVFERHKVMDVRVGDESTSKNTIQTFTCDRLTENLPDSTDALIIALEDLLEGLYGYI